MPVAVGQRRETTPNPPGERGQLLITELALLLEQGAAQYRFRRQPLPPGRAQPLAPQIAGNLAQQGALSIQPIRQRLQLAPDLVSGKDLEYGGLDGALLSHCRLRR